ncbi:hypothetical protein CYLTODRAFT_222159 [Cylindrobasidium torrendii FP15055 ss-10]|uniref:DinB-like domain-containing protein n=1 Tax=Cylindrobasidium torrendii FP15055 ss-10 TaxID=1314674 RepID=A0A0D7BGT1_9AGAR|nr:hypothetical protein CYLTODRAFT_222159 [Cylindrobasidium torrendii FP15055 ss-10]
MSIMSPTDVHHEIPENVLQLVAVSKILIEQALGVIDGLTSDEQLVASSRFLPGSTLGKHFRHARDHFELLLTAISSPGPYEFSYDTRSRNVPMESSRSAAKHAFLDTIRALDEKAHTVDFDTPVTLHAVTPHMQTFQSTYGRELWFGALHCIHHWSMVRVIAGEQGINLADDFGYAPSTLVSQGREVPLGVGTSKI